MEPFALELRSENASYPVWIGGEKVPRGALSRNVPRGTLSRNVPRGTLSRNVPRGTLSRNVPRGTLSRNVPRGTFKESKNAPKVIDLSANPQAFEDDLLLGILIGEGHFGDDTCQPHRNLKMHVRHEPLLARFQRLWPGACLYGPYNHNNRRYFQPMFRCSVLRYRLIPFLARLPWKSIDPHSYGRFAAMLERYDLPVGPQERNDTSI